LVQIIPSVQKQGSLPLQNGPLSSKFKFTHNQTNRDEYLPHAQAWWPSNQQVEELHPENLQASLMPIITFTTALLLAYQV
jgi:hypothetical protein